ADGLDTEIRPFGDEYLLIKWAQTFDESLEEGGALDAGLIRALWERRRQEGLSYRAEYGRVGPDYLPRLGFQSRRDFSLYGGGLGYAWFPGTSSPFRTIGFGVNTEHYYRNADQTPESRSTRPEFLLGFKNGAFFTLSSTTSFESIVDPFEIAELPIDPGEYWFTEGALSFRGSRGWPVRGSVTTTAGTFYDGTRVSGNITPSFNITSHLEVAPSYEINRFVFDDETTLTHLGRLRLDYALNTHLSLGVFGQYNSTVDQTSVNARFRYHFREGTDLWIVYNEGFNLERDLDDPRLPLSVGRSLLVKYTHTFGF
ncbi:MAG: hypothetical protein OEU54_17430, partial [Gemmatimonadota bacterium]|nr:hypothetical protein [Gemmatimonadota bacterium]